MKIRNSIKRLTAFALMLCLCIGAGFSGVETVKADPAEFYISDLQQAEAGGVYYYRLTIKETVRTALRIKLVESQNVNIQVFYGESTREKAHEKTLYSYLFLYSDWDNSYSSQTAPTLDPGTYTVKVTFEKATAYIMTFAREYSELENIKTDPSIPADSGQKLDGDPSPAPTPDPTPAPDDSDQSTDTKPTLPGNRGKISKENLTLVCGYEETLEILELDIDGAVTWTTSNKYVAAVSDDGTVTAKKAGFVTIRAVAKDTDGFTRYYHCSVTVKANEYKKSQIKLSSVPKKECTVQVYKFSYDKNGNLVLECLAANNSGRKITALKNLKINIKDADGKALAAYQASTKKLTVSNGKKKTFKITIQKSKLKNQELVNLTTCKCSVSSKYK